MEPYVLGVDSGGTKCLIRAVRPDGTFLAEYSGETSRHHGLEEAEVVRRIERTVDACLAQFGGKREACLAVAAGVSGIDSDEDAAIVDRIYHSLKGFSCPIRCLNDAELTHYAVTGGVGVLVISGTGSIAYGKNAAGESARVGGWVFTIMSDEGSGSYISRQALHYFSRYLDGCVEETELVQLVKKRVGISTRKELMDLCIQLGTPPWTLPRLSIEVDEAAAAGDPYALAILEDAARCTFRLADILVQKLRLYEEAQFKVGVWGSAIVKSQYHFSEFCRLFHEKYDNVSVVKPQKDAADGACRLALEMIGK